MPDIGQYVFVIEDPQIKTDKNIVYVGVSSQPWETIKRIFSRPTGARVTQWINSLREVYGTKLVFEQSQPCRRWHGDEVPMLVPKTGETLMVWRVIDFIAADEDPLEGDLALHARGSAKAMWIAKLRAEGHPIVTQVAGRRPKTS